MSNEIIRLYYARKNVKREKIANICVFGCTVYAMVPDEKKGKVHAYQMDTKCLFLDYYEETKAYRLMCW